MNVRRLAIVRIFFAIVIITAGVYLLKHSDNTLISNNKTTFVVAQNLTEQQVLDVIDIAKNDIDLETELAGVSTALFNLNVPDAYNASRIKNVSVLSYEDKDVGISGALPAVTYVIGEEGQRGATVIAFIDPDEKRVVYIKETPRLAPGIGLFNMYIVDTGYKPDTRLTDEQQSEAISLALKNSSVKELLGEQNYTNAYVSIRSTSILKGETNVRESYPEASFMVINRSGLNYVVHAVVNLKSKRITYVNSLGFPLPPEY